MFITLVATTNKTIHAKKPLAESKPSFCQHFLLITMQAIYGYSKLRYCCFLKREWVGHVACPITPRTKCVPSGFRPIWGGEENDPEQALQAEYNIKIIKITHFLGLCATISKNVYIQALKSTFVEITRLSNLRIIFTWNKNTIVNKL